MEFNKVEKRKKVYSRRFSKPLEYINWRLCLKELGKHQFKNDEMFIIADFFDENIGDIFLPTKYTKRKQTS